MKSILCAILIGLAIGLLCSQSIESPANPTPAPNPTAPSQASANISFRQLQTMAQVNLKNPFRVQLASLDLIHQVSAEQLIEAVRDGDIRNTRGIAAAYGEGNELEAAFQIIAMGGSAQALNLTEVILDPDTFQHIQEVIVGTCVQHDPKELLKHLRSLPLGQQRFDLVKQSANMWAAINPEEAMNHLEELMNLLGDDAPGIARDMLDRWNEQNFEDAERWVLEVSAPHRRDKLYRTLLSSRLHWGGEDAVNFILERNDAVSRSFLAGAFGKWAYNKPEAAIQRMITLHDQPELWDSAEHMGKMAASGLFRKQHQVNILTLRDLFPEQRMRRQFLRGAVNEAARLDPEMAAEIIEAIPDTKERESFRNYLNR